MTDEHLDGILAEVGEDRRAFIKRLVLGTAFAVPVVASFGMGNVWAGKPTTSNQPGGQQYCAPPNQMESTGGPDSWAIHHYLYSALQIAEQVRQGALRKTIQKAIEANDSCDLSLTRQLITDAVAQVEALSAKGRLDESTASELLARLDLAADEIDNFA